MSFWRQPWTPPWTEPRKRYMQLPKVEVVNTPPEMYKKQNSWKKWIYLRISFPFFLRWLPTTRYPPFALATASSPTSDPITSVAWDWVEVSTWRTHFLYPNQNHTSFSSVDCSEKWQLLGTGNGRRKTWFLQSQVSSFCVQTCFFQVRLTVA